VTEDINLGGGNIASRGTYIWSTGGGYKLDDGTTDAGNKIVCDIKTQQVAPVMGDSDLFTAEIDCESKAQTADIETEFITDNVTIPPGQTTKIQVPFGRSNYLVGAPPEAFGLRHAVRLKWEDPRVKIHGVGIVVEPRGRSTPL